MRLRGEVLKDHAFYRNDYFGKKIESKTPESVGIV